MITTLGALTIVGTVGTDLLGRVIGASIDGLKNIYSFVSSSSDYNVQRYKDELEIMDIELKLNLINNWLQTNKDTSNKLIYDGVLDTCTKITNLIEIIEDKIKTQNIKWFYTWRTLDLDNEIKQLYKYSKILKERIPLLNFI